MLHVVVVGGGPAGLIAAETLAKGGIATTLIERHPERVRPCVELITHRLLEEFEIPADMLSQRVEEIGVFAPLGRVAYMTLGGGDRFAGVLPREGLMALLRRRAQEAGVTFVHGTFLRFRHGEGDYPQAEVRLAETGEVTQLAAEVMVGADGVGSRVARSLGLKPLPIGVVYQERFAAPAGTMAPATMHLHLGRKVSSDYFGWLFPQREQVLVGVTTENRSGKRVWDGLTELKKRLSAQLEGARSLGREAFCYPLAAREKLAHDRVLLVGDAAGLVCPASRDGLYFACSSGRLAAETILHHQHVPVPERLAEYGQAWNAEFGRFFAGQKKLEKLFFGSDRRREVLIELAWDRETAQAGVEAFLSKQPFAPSIKLSARLKAKLAWLLMRYSMKNPKRMEGDAMVRQLPTSENYLELALKTKTGPLRLPATLAEAEQASKEISPTP